MHRFLFILFLLPVMAWAGKDTPAKRLVSLLAECKEREELVPDSFFFDVLLLKQEIKEQKDSASKAIYSATLAHLLMQNQHLSQKWSRETKSHPDSVREWSREEYIQHASDLYRYTLRDLELLHRVPTKEWIPLVNRGGDEKVYGSSMLAVVWQAMYSDIYYENRKTNGLPLFGTLIQFYKERGLREAAFRLCMDSLFESSMASKKKYLLQLKEEYKDLKSCERVYQELARFKNQPEEQRQVIEEGLRLYPNSALLKNWILNQEAPYLQCRMETYLYPNSEEDVFIQAKNLQNITLTTYRLPDDFKPSDTEDLLNQVLRVGKQSGKSVYTLAPHPAYEQWTDTLRMQTSSVGKYAVVMQGNTKARLDKKQEPQVHLFYVSRLRAFSYMMPANRTRLVVVDGQSGKPEVGVTVKVMQTSNKGKKTYAEYITDERGIVEFATNFDQKIKLSKGEDCMLPEVNGSSSFMVQNYSTTTKENNISIYSDRSVYRPGQTVYIGAVAYFREGLKANVNSGKDYKLILTDTKGNTIAEHLLKTNEFGVISDSVSLPKDAAPGSYTIRIDNKRYSFRVEEYRRPVFYAEIDPAPDASPSADTIRMTGRAMTYSGVPVANARIKGSLRYHSGFLYGRSLIEAVFIDSIYTDAEGRFTIPVSLSPVKKNNLKNANIVLKIDVLNKQGETEQAQSNIRFSTKAYVLESGISERQNRDMLKPWSFGLYASTGARVNGDIVCRIMEGKDTEKARFLIPANKPSIPAELKTLPSGTYKVLAEYVNGSDTARCEQPLELFSLSDTHLVGEKDLSIYTPCDTFAIDRPAKVQIGTSLKQAWIYCTMMHHNNVFLDTLICVRDTAFVWEVPYKEEFGDGVSVKVALYHHGFKREEVNLYHALPDKTLRAHWETFRDRLRPGQQEEWRLSLRRPDGTPADANVLLSMYDASLDAIHKHFMNFRMQYQHQIPNLFTRGVVVPTSQRYYFHFPVQMLKVKDWQFSQYNPEYIYDVLSLQDFSLSIVPTSAGLKGGRTMRLRGTEEFSENREFASAVQQSSRAKAVNAVAAQVFNSVDADVALQGQIAGLDIESPELPGSIIRGAKDGAFSELAFFCPTLRTDANGEVRISFTLPESLTSWHLLGFAHDKDLYSTQIDETIVVQKELMAELYLPRFLRSGDEASFTASIRNVSERLQQGKASCVIMDAATEKVLTSFPVQFRLEASRDTVYTFPVGSLENYTALLVKWMAEGSDYSDGEQRQLPVLSDLETVTETRAFSINKKGTMPFNLESLFAHNHPSATNRNMVVEYTARPAWMALKALPSLFTPHCKCVLCTSSAYYATTMAQHILRQVPDADALVDSLYYSDMLSLDYRMSLLSSLSALQLYDGSFTWFPGMKGNAYLTREVAYQLVRLHHIGVATDVASVVAERMLQKAVDYLAKETHKQVQWMQKEKDSQVGLSTLRYLYILSLSDIKLSEEYQEDEKFLVDRLLHSPADKKVSIEEAALASMVLKHNGQEKQAESYLEGLSKKLTHPDGYYISYPSGSFTSINRKVQTHVQVMEAYREVKPSEEQLLNGMTEWLLQQKRTQQWEEPVKTVNAVYALLQDDTQPLANGNSDVLKLRDGQKTHTFVTPHTSMGYLRDSLTVSAPKEIRVEKHGQGVSWGAVYATYQMPLDSVRASWQGFHIRRDVSSLQPKVGDRLHVRYTITADRDYEFVQLTAPRSAAAEPDASLSGYRYQNGLGYYRMIRDDRTEYYFDRMPKGTYVIEEDWLISRTGNYQTGITVIKCLYAPEFQSFTTSDRLVSQ
ncbi:MAG: hypothetical protein J6W52_02810 [Bacteroidaceae bacterium]|nr:hypothetical protein [Bacteroidaceae bacterium]